jgi:hypothetical protein
VSDLITYNQIYFTWDPNLEIDFSHYIIKRLSMEGSGSYEVLNSNFTDILYIDENLDQNTLYYYQVIAVDLSGNESDASEIAISTLLDTRVPLPPTFFQIFPCNESFQLIWENSNSDNVTKYEVVVQRITNENVDDGDPIVFSDIYQDNTVGNQYLFIDNLINNLRYKVSIKSISLNDVESDVIFQISFPVSSQNNVDVQNIIVDFSEGIFENIDIEIDVRWNYMVEEYLVIPDEFLIYFIENGGRVSSAIIIKELDSLIQCESDAELNQ